MRHMKPFANTDLPLQWAIVYELLAERKGVGYDDMHYMSIDEPWLNINSYSRGQWWSIQCDCETCKPLEETFEPFSRMIERISDPEWRKAHGYSPL